MLRHFMISSGAALLALAACSAPVEPPESSPSLPGLGGETMAYTPNETLSQTLPELSEALTEGDVTSVDLTAAYLARIDALDRSGPTLRSVLTLNPNAQRFAQESDERRAAGNSFGPLDGVPILIKDNIETLDAMPTTAGSSALSQNQAGRDSPLVAGLRAQGAIILGKTNLSQWANFRSSQSISGWSALGGQVKNPHVLDRTPCGSSSGSGAAIAASLAAGAVGTETNGSIICPANMMGIVGFKPSVGLISSDQIIPIAPSQDTAGPMTKTVRGAAMMLNAMASGELDTDFTEALSPDALNGKRVAVLRFAQGSNSDILAAFDASLDILQAQGAELVDVTEFDRGTDRLWADSMTLMEYEFKASLNTYLANAPISVEIGSLGDLIAYNAARQETELALFGQEIFESSNRRGDLSAADYIRAKRAVQFATRERGIDALLAEYDADILVAPSGPIAPPMDPVNGDVWPEWIGAGSMAAISGYPHLTVPMGAVRDVPIGLSFIATAGEDVAVLAMGYAFEQASRARIEPRYLSSSLRQSEIAPALNGFGR